MEIGFASTELGAGRRGVGDAIDPAVGIEIVAPVGREVERGAVVALVRGNDPDRLEAAGRRVGGAFEIAGERPVVPPRVLGLLEGPGT
jgi:thymidine phosphorylase